MNNLRLPVPAPPDPMARTTDDAAGLDRTRARSEEIAKTREEAGLEAIATRDAEAQRQREREEVDLQRARELEAEERESRRISAQARTRTNVGHVKSVVGSVVGVLAAGAGFVIGGLPLGALALGATVLGLSLSGKKGRA